MASLETSALGECFPELELAVAPATQIIAIENTQDIFEPDVDIGNREQAKAKRKRGDASMVSLGLLIQKGVGCIVLINSKGRELARMDIADSVDATEEEIFNTFRRRIPNCERLFAAVGARKGRGGAIQEAEKFIQNVVGQLRPKVDKLILSCGGDNNVVLFVAVRKTSIGISVVYEESQGMMESLCAFHHDEIYVPLTGLEPTSGIVDHSNTRSKVRSAKALLTVMQEMVTEDSSLEIALLLRSIQGADWEKAFDTRPSKSSLQSHIFSASKSSFFSESGILAAYSSTSQADMQRGSIETKNTKLLRSLFSQPVGEIHATNIEISSFIYLWGYDVFSSVLMKYRQELRVSNRHRQTHSPLSEDSLTALAKWAQNSIFSSPIPKLIASSDELGTATSEHSTDLPDTFECLELQEHECSGYSDTYCITGSEEYVRIPGLSHDADAHAPFSVFRTVEDSSLLFLDFLRRCQDGVCLHAHSDSSGINSSLLFALPPYDRTTSKITHGPPVLVDYTSIEDTVVVSCTCPAARLAMAASASERLAEISGIMNGECWHKFVLKKEILVRRLATQKDVIKCDPVSGIPTDFVRIVGAKQAAAGVVRSTAIAGPSRLYIVAHSNHGLGGPGNMRLAVVTLGIIEGRLQVSCDVCGNASKSQTGASKKAVCRHYELIKNRAKSPVTDDDIRLKSFLDRAAVCVERLPDIVYNTSTDLWAFPSLDKDSVGIFEKVTGEAIAPPLFPFGSAPASKSVPSNLRPPTFLGGPGDPNMIRLSLLLDIAHGLSIDHVLLSREVVIQRCSCDNFNPKWVSIMMKPGESAICSLCSQELPPSVSFSTCHTCHVKCCSTCRGSEPISSDSLFKSVFHEIAHVSFASSEPLLTFVAAASSIVAMPSESLGLLELKPPIPSFSIEASVSVALGRKCTYSKDGYRPLHRSRVFGFSYSAEAQVFSLECSMRHKECSLPFIGQHRGMHCQSSESIYRVELFEYFWFLLRHSRGMGAASFVQLIQLVYDRNGAGNFVSEPSFRAAIFGYFSSLKIDFNVPCMACPILKCGETGVLFSACKRVQIDAISLRCLDQKGGAVSPLFDDPVDASTLIDCKNEHIYDRLFFPGSRTKSTIGKLRLKLQALCKIVLDEPMASSFSCVAEKYSTLADEFQTLPSVDYVSPVIRIIVDSLGNPPDLLMRNLATMLLRMCDDHAGEILQIINEPEIRFIEDVLQRAKNGTLSSLYLRLRLVSDIRASLVELVRSALVRVQPGNRDTIVPHVEHLLLGMHRMAKDEFLRAGGDRASIEASLIPLASRVKNDPSKTGISINFTKGGAQLRYPPRFKNEPSDKGKKSGKDKCSKPQHLYTRHQKFLSKTKGLFNVICLESGQPMAQMIMRASEGRSLGDMLFFLFLPRFPRIISSDIGCQGSSWARCRLRFYFRRWRWLVDLFHIGPHKCKLITNPREFSSMRELNDSIVEQLHSAQRALGMTMQSTSSERAMFLVQLINYDIYCKLANDAKFSRVWPEDAPVYTDDDDVAADVPATATPSLSSEEVPLPSDEENEGSASDSEPEDDSDGDDSNSEIAGIDNLEDFLSL